jgi:hypothetical protein
MLERNYNMTSLLGSLLDLSRYSGPDHDASEVSFLFKVINDRY